MVIRLSDSELAAVKKKIAASGKNQQTFLLTAILGANIIDTSGMKELLTEMKRIGNNLNQIAKRCNQGNPLVAEEVQKMGRELNNVWRLLRLFLQERG